MIIGICAFTEKGWKLASILEQLFPEHIFEPRREETLETWFSLQFQRSAPVLFIGATGIAVRSLTQIPKDKLTDSPVLVLDEEGNFVIPLLSGHMGGANAWAKEIEKRMILNPELAQYHMAQAVITTATDVQQVFSVDVFAKNNGCTIVNRKGIQQVSSKLLSQGKIRVCIDPALTYDREQVPQEMEILPFPPQVPVDVWMVTEDSLPLWKEWGRGPAAVGRDSGTEALCLLWKPYVLGLGCKKGTTEQQWDAFLLEMLPTEVDLSKVAKACSIDLKQKEYGLVLWAQMHQIPFQTFSAEALDAVEGNFAVSEFVKTVTGVSNVCERAALLGAEEQGTFVLHKTAKDGMTLAIVKRKGKIRTWET